MSMLGDWRRVRRLGAYLRRDRRRLFLSLFLLVPVALAGAVQPLLVGQVISVIRSEASLPWLAALSVPRQLPRFPGVSVHGATPTATKTPTHRKMVYHRRPARGTI